MNQAGDLAGSKFPIGLRLSAIAATQLLEKQNLLEFQKWLSVNDCFVFTINGFPYGSFHSTRVKEKVFQPDWTSPERLHYTKQLFKIIATICPENLSGSISSLPGSHKTFAADEAEIFKNLTNLALFIEDLSSETGRDLHLGLEPEPLGHFENTNETIQFFERLHSFAKQPEIIRQRIGLNFDSCHFAVEYEDAASSLDRMVKNSGIRLSKVHLSNALRINPQDPEALKAIRQFDEPTYFHQTITKDLDGNLERHLDLPDFLNHIDSDVEKTKSLTEARIHFHIPLDAQPEFPLLSTSEHVQDTINWCRLNPDVCEHFEIETYTWSVLPNELQRPVEEQIAAEFRWVYQQLNKQLT